MQSFLHDISASDNGSPQQICYKWLSVQKILFGQTTESATESFSQETLAYIMMHGQTIFACKWISSSDTLFEIIDHPVTFWLMNVYHQTLAPNKSLVQKTYPS